MSVEYKLEENRKNHIKLKELEKKLPPFMKSYFTYLSETRRLSMRTVVAYAYDLETFCYFMLRNNPLIKQYADIVPDILERLQPQDISEYMAFLSFYEKDGAEYQNTENGKARKLSCLKSFWKWMIGFNILKNDPTTIVSAPKIKSKEIVKMDSDEVSSVLQKAKDKTSLTGRQRQITETLGLGKRDEAIIALLLGTGIRVSECAGLDVKDIDFKENSAKIIRKGGDESKVFFNDDVREVLYDYIAAGRKEPADNSPALFISARGKRMCVRSIERIVEKYIKPMFSDKNITTHKLRSTYATALYKSSRDIYLTADALGHKNVQTTSKYADIGNQRRKEAASYIQWPAAK